MLNEETKNTATWGLAPRVNQNRENGDSKAWPPG